MKKYEQIVRYIMFFGLLILAIGFLFSLDLWVDHPPIDCIGIGCYGD